MLVEFVRLGRFRVLRVAFSVVVDDSRNTLQYMRQCALLGKSKHYSDKSVVKVTKLVATLANAQSLKC